MHYIRAMSGRAFATGILLVPLAWAAEANLARTAKAAASDATLGNPAAHAADGSIDTYWEAPESGAWVELAWNGPVHTRELLIRRIEAEEGTADLTSARVETFENGAWKTISLLGNGKSPLPLLIHARLPEIQAERLRLGGLASRTRIREIEVYAELAPPWLDVRGDAKGNIIGVLTDAFGAAGLHATVRVSGSAGGKTWSQSAPTNPQGEFTLAMPVGTAGRVEFSASVDGQSIIKTVDAGDIHQGLVPRPEGDFTLALDEEWRFRPDPDEDFASLGFNESSWSRIEVPSHWAMQGFEAQSGYGGYRKRIQIPAAWRGRRIRVAFDGVYSGAEVWWNGQRAGSHLGGATPFQLDVSDHAVPGAANVLAVRVKEQSMASELDHMSMYADFSLAGIFRSVRVFAVPKFHLARVQSHSEGATLVADVSVVNESSAATAATLRLRLLDAEKRVAAESERISLDLAAWSGVNRQVRIPVTAPRQWNAEHPNLYTLETVLSRGNDEIERVTRKAGFRETRIRGTQVLINGVPVKLKGTCHHDSHPRMGRAVTPALERQDLELIKEANLDSVRTSHYPPLPELLDIADELGVYIEDEASFCWVSNAADLRYGALTRQLTAEMVERDMSHPSVAYWSSGNESGWGPALDMGEREIRNSDPSRPVIGSWSRHFDMTVRHNPITVAGIRKLENNDRPVIWDESLCIFQGIFGDADELWRDPGDRDYYVAPLVGVWDALWHSRVVQGSFIWAWSDDLFLVPGRASEYGRHYTEGHGLDRAYHQPGRGLVGDAPWGVVDGWRRKKPEFWHVKELHSPVRIQSRQLPGTRPLRIPVENRYFFTNLSELQIEWTLAGRSGTVQASIAPQTSSAVELPVDFEIPAGSILDLRFLNGKRLVQRSRIQIGEAPAPADPPRTAGALRRIHQELLSDTNPRIVGDRFEVAFSDYRGLLRYALAGGEMTLYEQPQIHVLPARPSLPAFPRVETWQLDRPIKIEDHDGVMNILLQGHYTNLVGSYGIRIAPEGDLRVSYDFEYTGPDLNAREIGFRFAVPLTMDDLSWTRRGEWSWYPEDHIAALTGSVRAHSGRPAISPPDWPYGEDDTPMGTNAFRGTKRNLLDAALKDGSGRGVSIRSDGSQHLRASVESDRIAVFVNDWFGGTSSRAAEWTENYGEGRLLRTGDRITGTLRLRLLGETNANR